MQPFTVFDGMALTCTVFCAALGWIFWREHNKSNVAGFRVLSLALTLAAYAWFGSVFVGSLELRGSFNDLYVAVPEVVAFVLLLVGFNQWIRVKDASWAAELKVALPLLTVGVVVKLIGGPVYSLAAATACLTGACGIRALLKHRSEPQSGYWLIALAFFTHPLFYLPLRLQADGISTEHLNQLLCIPFSMMGGVIVAVSFSSSREISFKYAKQLEETREKMHRMLYTDEHTGIASRQAQFELINELARSGTSFSTIGISLKGISQINSNFGVAMCDAVIARAVSAIREIVPSGAKLGCSSGSRFTLILVEVTDTVTLNQIAQSIIERMGKPIEQDALQFYLDVALGAAVFPLHSPNVGEFIRNVFVALNAAELKDGANFCIFEYSMDVAALHQHWLDINLRLGFEQNQFELHYQPKVNIGNKTITSVEALIRWTHPKRGNIRPDEFIARCESNGLMIPLGRWIIDTAARQAAQWSEQGKTLRIAINISAKQLQDSELLQRLTAAQAIASGLLDIELTESCLAGSERQILEFIHQCRVLGFGVHLDDFGTGYSSLSRLCILPLTVMKLDRSFIMEVGKSGKGQALLKSMIGMAKELDLSIVAEGVETREQVDFLIDLGVTVAQGWLYAPAMTAAKLEAWLHAYAYQAEAID